MEKSKSVNLGTIEVTADREPGDEIALEHLLEQDKVDLGGPYNCLQIVETTNSVET